MILSLDGTAHPAPIQPFPPIRITIIKLSSHVTLSFTLAESACAPAEEGRMTVMTCYTESIHCVSSTDGPHLTWYAGDRDVADCDNNLKCSSHYNEDMHTTINDIVSTLRIYKVFRTFKMETTWRCKRCTVDPIYVAGERLEIYGEGSAYTSPNEKYSKL